MGIESSEPKTRIVAFDPEHLERVLEITRAAWTSVFPLLREDIPGYVFEAFYPDGWLNRQLADVEATCLDQETDMWVAVTGGSLSGFLGLRAHEEDSMGEIYIIAVDPVHQQCGVGSALMGFAFDWMRERGLAMAMAGRALVWHFLHDGPRLCGPLRAGSVARIEDRPWQIGSRQV